MGEPDLIHLHGFENITNLCSKKNIGTRNEGGIAIVCKHILCKGITVGKNGNDGILLLKLDQNFVAAIFVFLTFHMRNLNIMIHVFVI